MTEMSATPGRAAMKVFELKKPFEYRGAFYKDFTAREPKVRDLRTFLKNVDRDAIQAMEVTLANLCQIDEPIVSELSIEDFAIMKKWFEGFLKHMMNDSED